MGMFFMDTLQFLAWIAAAVTGAALALALQQLTGGRNRYDLAQFAALVADLRKERDLLTNALIEARAEIERLRQEVQAARQQLAALGFADGGHAAGAFPLRNRTVLAILGDDPALLADEAALRAVETATGLTFRRVRQATKAKIAACLDRARLHGRPYDLVHIAAHLGPQGVLLGGGGLVDGAWLSEHLQGVQVALLAGCAGDAVGDWLGGVRYAVSLAEAVSHEDASRFTQAFWGAIGQGLHPEAALATALERAPAGLGEYVERHW